MKPWCSGASQTRNKISHESNHRVREACVLQHVSFTWMTSALAFPEISAAFLGSCGGGRASDRLRARFLHSVRRSHCDRLFLPRRSHSLG